MKPLHRRRIARTLARLAGLVTLLLLVALLVALAAGEGRKKGRGQERGGGDPAENRPKPGATPFVDTHSHLIGSERSRGQTRYFYEASAKFALSVLDAQGVEKAILMPQPSGQDKSDADNYVAYRKVAQRYPDRLYFAGGGAALNPMIHKNEPGSVDDGLRRRFEALAQEIADAGAVAYGEMAAEHFSFHPGHPYESAPPDHPLFLLLADVAARNGLPIDLHMELMKEDMPMPEAVRSRSPNNPARLRGNLEAFERLLAHNPGAKIVWVHAGWDNTGDRTVPLMRRLLAEHPNLYMSLKFARGGLPESQLVSGGQIRAEWIALLRAFPERFVMGADQHFGEQKSDSFKGQVIERENERMARTMFDWLPPDLARKVGRENYLNIYRLR